MKTLKTIMRTGAAGILLAAGLAGASAPAQAETKIGVLLPLSGPLASLGNDVYRGFQLAQDMVNANGGVLGEQVEFAVADVPGSTEATSQANRLITNEGVEVIVGSYASSISFAASQVAERNGVIYLEQGAVADDITKRGFKYLFRLIYPATELGRGAATFVTDVILPRLDIPLDKARVAIMNEDSFYGTAVTQGAHQWLTEKGVEIVDETSYSYKTNDLSSVVQRYKSLQPDVIIATSYTPDAILFWRQAREAGLKVKAFIGNGGGHNIQDFADALGDDVNGVFNAGTSAYFNPEGLTKEAAALYKEFHEKYVAKFDRKPSAHSAMGFNAMYLLLTEALPAAGKVDADALREALLAMDKPTGSTIVGWGVKFDPETQNNTRAFPMIDQWQQKEIRTIYPWDFGLTDNIVLPLPDWGQRADIGN
ncbi:MAG: ABC transporter substrate-binding protein [Alphaproteobacteria bacterium]|nr:ABC transporter substrate-binding protein [Alphaproteobacteria bacterium]MDX5369825.1 ABC transporter substrate-binding protein [Alphaproteobacteria bacterium]